ncbi:hypothetical protein A2954_03815 [Candidatus Roizmanbacteria bacterium RIFCSPLOWO2_01_FULL_37_12]|uniref:Glycosyl transferase family 1 domain-containing protein n=1 Tax=Candidatus Roizmanbacteria bacterium RIFCSPLOWO2_01_FULL_37_12 TaxID=1802056 RepID=A0A1F7IEK6_9BACT|nr:MAG: hypothetical protein A3D76_02785 [Candidatus Roizmanbacteria bacterium RIFCSPHIGHO2_02_FULL_37_9b]OGK41813.1 MAG: hypothetical protein A2954_03815 [Candidatus Roizmanbacteria bacterium RIFCSPLOWO2_01_FULL_37_12]
MNLGIDLSQIVYEGTGIARFTKGLTNAILDFDKKNSWTFFFSSLRKNLDPEIKNKIEYKGHKLIKWKLPPTFLSFLFNDLHNLLNLTPIPHILTANLDWFITSDWSEPPLNIKKAAIVHDLVFLRYPETVAPKILQTQKKRLNLIKQESRIVFTDSNATKYDLADLLKIGSKKIIVNYPGVEVKKPTIEQINITIKKYHLNHPFILTVGKQEPRKNIDRLISAFSKLEDKKLDLVIVGPKGWEAESINYQLSNIKYLGLVSDIELFSLYSSCLFFIYPSLWEGFGYPVVEAMNFATPVATSNNSSLKEIGHDAAFLFNPLKVDEISHCIKVMKSNIRLRKVLSKKGQERSKIYIWKTYFNKLIHTLYDHRS